MFDIGAGEILVVVIVAILVIGPKDMPQALRTAGRWIGKVRRMSNHFRAGVDAMVREAEMEDIQKEWAERNRQIMAEYPDADTSGAPHTGLPDASGSDGPQMEPLAPPPPATGVSAEDRLPPPASDASEPELPLASQTGAKDS